MNPPKLVICAENGKTSFGLPYIAPLVEQYFQISQFDPGKTYDKSDTIFVMSMYYNYNMTEYLDRGYKFLIDAFWEARPFERGTLSLQGRDNVYSGVGSSGVNPSIGKTIEVPNYFWYNESLWYHQLGYQNYIPKRTNSKLFLMPIGKIKPHRDLIVEKLSGLLDQALYSYTRRGILLPGTPEKTFAGFDEQRQFMPEWYNDTMFSVVVETDVSTRGFDVFITEKTWKAIAHQHPFLIYGVPGVIKHLHSQEFETFDHIFDESYDDLGDDQKIDIIVKNIEEFDIEKYADPLTEKKVKHNFQRFFDQELVKIKYVQDIVTPIIGILDD